MNKSNLGDTEILNNTARVQGERGTSQLQYTLPSGRKVTSEWIPDEQLKGKVFIQWCGAVRDQDQFDIEERDAAEQAAIAAKRTRAQLSPAQPTEHVPVRSDVSNKLSDGSEDQSARTLPALSNLLRQPSVLEQRQLPDDPTDLAVAKLNALRIQLAETQDQLSALSAQEAGLKAAISRWETVVASLRGPIVEVPPSQLEKLQSARPGQVIMMPEDWR